MGKNYQNAKNETSNGAMPDEVSVAVSEIAADVREDLLAWPWAPACR